MDEKGVKSRKSWRLEQATVLFQLIERIVDYGGRGIEGIQAYRWLLSNQNNRCLFAGINQWYEKWVKSGHGLFVTRKSAAILGSNLI